MGVSPSEFESFELEYSLFDIRIDDIPIWERLRFDVFSEIKRQNGTGRAHTDVGTEWQDYIRGASLFARNLMRNNPFLAGQHDILYIGHHRRKKQDDGYWLDIYCDPIHEACDYDYVQFEKPHELTHFRPARTANHRYLDLIEYSGTIQQLLGINKPVVPNTERTQLEAASDRIREQFDAEIDLVSMTEEMLHLRRARLPLYRRLIEHVDPELAVVVVSYIRETFIEACKEYDVPVVELQHGVIYHHHFGYSFSGPRTKETFPDYLLTFGEFWTDAAAYPIPAERVIPVGYPYLEQSVDKYDDVKRKNQLLFISQGTIGEQLSKFAMEVEQHPEMDYDIVYKLHPGEYNRWETEYPWLLDADFEIIDTADRQLYKLFAESSTQIGVGSTAVYEGLAFGLETYVYDCPGSEVLQPLVDDGSAVVISSVEEFVSSIESNEGLFDREYYFALNSTKRACDTINRLGDDGTINESR